MFQKITIIDDCGSTRNVSSQNLNRLPGNVEMPRIARQVCQAILMGGIGFEHHPLNGGQRTSIKKNSNAFEKTLEFRRVGGIGPVPNHFLPYF